MKNLHVLSVKEVLINDLEKQMAYILLKMYFMGEAKVIDDECVK